MEQDSSNYVAESNKIWKAKFDQLKDPFNAEEYKPDVTFQEAKNKRITWIRYSTILTTMIPAQAWDNEKVRNDGCLVFQAEAQTLGRGQGANVWLSPPGNVYLTALTEVNTDQLPLLSVLACSAVIRTVKEFLPGQKVYNKWVNDIFIEGKKVGGLLTKGLNYGQRWLGVFGIGVNIHEAPIAGSSCLQKYSEKKLSVKDFSVKLVHNLLYALANREESLNIYRDSLSFIGEKVNIYDVGLKNVEHSGCFKDINQFGNAILDVDGKDVTVTAGRMREAFGAKLKGVYTNELKSTMWINEVDEKNLTFVGKYSTGAGRPTPQEHFTVNGHFQQSNEKMCVISWIVNWKNESKSYNSIAAFNGYAVFGESNKVTIHSNWLLTHLDPQTPSEKIGLYELSKASVGPNVFHKETK